MRSHSRIMQGNVSLTLLSLLCVAAANAALPISRSSNFVRIEANSSEAYAVAEKEIAYNFLQRWGLGEKRHFVELAGTVRFSPNDNGANVSCVPARINYRPFGDQDICIFSYTEVLFCVMSMY